MTLETPLEEAAQRRSLLLQRFSDLHEYLCLLGDHVNLIHKNISQIEKTIEEIRSNHQSTIEANRVELDHIRQLMATKQEVDELLQELNDVIKGTFPPITVNPE